MGLGGSCEITWESAIELHVNAVLGVEKEIVKLFGSAVQFYPL